MDNLRGSVLMVLAMLGFAIEDMCVKLMAGALPTGEILALLGAGGAAIFGAVCLMRGERLLGRKPRSADDATCAMAESLIDRHLV